MTSPTLPLLPGRRRAEEFARLLDGGPATNDPGLAPLANLANALRSLPLGPTPDFRDTLRQRLVAVATVQGVGPAGSRTLRPVPAAPQAGGVTERLTAWAEGWRVRRKFTVATASVAAVVMLGGVGLAGSRSLPGDPFYGVKRGVESLQLAAAGSTEAKGERHLQFARTRLQEVTALVGDSKSLGAGRATGGDALVAGGSAIGGSLNSRVSSTLHAMDDETTAGTRDLTSVYQDSHDQAPLRLLQSFSAAQSAQLTAVIPTLPAAVVDQANQSLALVQRVGGRAQDLLAAESCTATCGPNAPAGVAAQPGTDDLGAKPCTCTGVNGPTNGSSNGAPTPNGQVGPTPAPTETPHPGKTGGPDQQPGSPSAQPSPTPTTLEDQIGGIISNLPVPITPPPLPLPIPAPSLPPLPIPVPTIPVPLP